MDIVMLVLGTLIAIFWISLEVDVTITEKEFKEAVVKCEANEGLRSYKTDNLEQQTAICQNGAVFTYVLGEKK